MTIIKIAFIFFFLCNSLYAQKRPDPYSLQELQMKFKHKNYTEKILLAFQKTMAGLSGTPELSEDVAGEIISWYTIQGMFSLYRTYSIQKNSLKEVATVPKDDSFLNKLNSYVSEKSKFSYLLDLWSFAFVRSKLSDNYYLIKATVKSFNSYPEIPNDDILIYDIEYKTKDFINFSLVRLKDIHTTTWIEVK